MSIVTDFKSIRQKLERQEQKADYDEKNPKPVESPVVWAPEWGYGGLSPADVNAMARAYMARSSKGFDLPDVRGQIKANG